MSKNEAELRNNFVMVENEVRGRSPMFIDATRRLLDQQTHARTTREVQIVGDQHGQAVALNMGKRLALNATPLHKGASRREGVTERDHAWRDGGHRRL